MYISPIQGFKSVVSNNYYNNYKVNKSAEFNQISFGSKVKTAQNVFDKYKPIIRHLENYTLTIHNREIANRILPEYTSKSFSKLFNFAKKKGTFNLNINPNTHYIQTSLIDPKENPLMSKLVWVTDSCRYMPVLKDRYPEAAVPLMENISKFYKKQERNFTKIINDPLQYELNHDWSKFSKNGIGHVFNPENMKTHKWFPHTRLESAGLYLQSMSDLIIDGFNGAKYGYKTSKEVSQNSIDALTNITAYLKKIIYPYAKSTGAWEEHTFNNTPSSDVAIINEGFRKIINLMYSPTKDVELLKIRQSLLNSKNGKVFKDEKGLKEMLKLGEYRIKTNSTDEVPNVRKLDGALSFIPHSETFSDNTIKDVIQIFKRMEALEKGYDGIPELVRENGTLRYNNDRYLNMTSGHQINRNKLQERTEAQWFMTSDISKSYGVAAKKLLDELENNPHDLTKLLLLNKAIEKQTEYINRAYGRITGKNSFKANGKLCPPYQIPEAYQAVSKSNGDIIFVPGTHTPLGWAQASLYDASKLMLENLKRLENLLK